MKYVTITISTALIVSSAILLLAMNYRQSDFKHNFIVEVSNPLAKDREQVIVHVAPSALPKNFNPKAFAVFDGTTEISSQYNTSDNDFPGIFVVLPLRASEKKKLTIRYDDSGVSESKYKKQTYAEISKKTGGEWKSRAYLGGRFENVDHLKVPKEHTVHSSYLRYEGPGWESDKVAYRLYLDERNANDVFGKRVDDVVLHNVGQDGIESYHDLSAWGMDIMKVGTSLGIGSISTYSDGKVVPVAQTDSVTCQIVENGDVYSSILVRYHGWNTGKTKVDLDSRITIHANTRLTHNLITVKGSLDNISTGLIKDDKAKVFQKKGDKNSYGYVATFGRQSLNNDNLGIVVFFKSSDFVEFVPDKESHVVKLKPTQGKIDYYFGAMWEMEKDGIRTEEEFLKYIDETAEELGAKVVVRVLGK